MPGTKMQEMRVNFEHVRVIAIKTGTIYVHSLGEGDISVRSIVAAFFARRGFATQNAVGRANLEA